MKFNFYCYTVKLPASKKIFKGVITFLIQDLYLKYHPGGKLTNTGFSCTQK